MENQENTPKTKLTVYGVATVTTGKANPDFHNCEALTIGGFLGEVYFKDGKAFGFNGYEAYIFDAKKFRRSLRFLKDHTPKYIRCYDNGGGEKKGGSLDRYTVVFTGNYKGKDRRFEFLSMSERPFHPQGFGQHSDSHAPIDYPSYSHLGKKIKFTDLPEDCQQLVLQDYIVNWEY